jgi:ATP-dependent helicase HepA
MAGRHALIGTKVRVAGFEHYGLGEVASYPDDAGTVAVDFYRGPVQFERVRTATICHEKIPVQTRCFVPLDTGFRMGRVLGCIDGNPGEPLRYHVALPNEGRARVLEESQFRVRSILGPSEPIETLGALAQETPFFFEHRARWIAAYDRSAEASRGLHGLDSASVELFPHQADAVRRVLQDPTVRYLLADEVGLGKTIEAGAILRQLEIDDSKCRSLVLVPPVLKGQWEWELQRRFHLARAVVAVHTDLERLLRDRFDVVVIDEAHRLIEVSSAGAMARFDHARVLCANARHLLLLSATPILHRDAEVLALLHLLDPDQYRLDDLDGFRRRVARRLPIGRLLLALERSSSPVVLRRQLELLGKELADDEEVQAALASAPPGSGPEYGEAWRALATRVRVLVAETWRLHRRLIRTRRSALIEDGEIQRLRQVEPPECVSSYTDDAEVFPGLWACVEELRNAAAARSATLPESDAKRLREGFLLLAQAAAVAGLHLRTLLLEMSNDPEWSFATDILRQIERAAELIPDTARLEALEAVLADRPEDERRWVVFCPDAGEADRVSRFLAKSFPDERVLKLAKPDALAAAEVLSEFENVPGRALLVVDPTAEEGLNLQAADGLVLLDLPFQPMRLEQRVGRLDRLNRTRPLRALSILSNDDADEARRAFDRAWYELLVEGFGLFRESIADVPYLLERQLATLSNLVFERGPAGFYDHVETLREALAAERREAEEQAVIDGTSVAGVRNASWWKALEEADADEDQLATAFQGYVTQTLGLRLESTDPPRTAMGSRRFLLRRDRSRDVLLPAERLLPLAGMIDIPFTFSRKRATQESDGQLLRPGGALLDWLRELADWDDRGRAFAVWRRVPDWHDPRVIVRICTTAALEECADSSSSSTHGFDAVGRASLRRLAGNWFTPWRGEWFMRLDGSAADQIEVTRCQAQYDKTFDENLGGPRAPALLTVAAATDWPGLCRSLAESALVQARQSGEFAQHLAQAQQDARTWFAQREARLRFRDRQHVANDAGVETAALAVLRQHVFGLLERPQVRVDAMGIYVLAAEACPR